MEEGKSCRAVFAPVLGIVEPVSPGHFPMCDTARLLPPQKAPASAANAVVGAAPCLY